MSPAPLTFDGILSSQWKAGSPTAAKAYVPAFYDVLDFDSYRLMGRVPSVRAHVTYPDHYALLLALLDVITQESGGTIDEILINSRMPSVVRVPQGFFGRNVLFLNEPRREAEHIAAHGTQVLVIEERFLRHSVEDADNSVKIVWYNAPQGADAALDRVITRLGSLGIQPLPRGTA